MSGPGSSVQGSARALLVGLALAGLLSGGRAGAQPVDEATRSSARQLGDEASDLFDKGDYKGALDKYERADALVHVPTLAVREARCLDKLGRLIEASERYVSVTRRELPPDALQVHKDAVVDATRELAALRERIPSVVIDVAGATDAEVTIDGARIPQALWGQKRAVDPGKHHVELRRGTTTLTRDIEVAEREVVPVKLDVPATPPPPRPRVPESSHDTGTSQGNGLRVLGGVALAVGGAGIVAGAITGGIVLSRRKSLESRCGAQLSCPPAAWSDADSYNGLRIVSSTAFIAGGVLAASGVVLLLAAPSARPPRRAAVRPWIGAASAGVAGSFE